MKGSRVTSAGVPPSLAKMPFGFSAGSARSEDGSEVFLEGTGNSYVLYFTHAFPPFSEVLGAVLQDPGDREASQESPLVGGGGISTGAGMEVELLGWARKTSCRRRRLRRAWSSPELPSVEGRKNFSRKNGKHVARAGFLNLCTVDIWGRIIPYCGGSPVCGRMLISIPGLYPLLASSTLCTPPRAPTS